MLDDLSRASFASDGFVVLRGLVPSMSVRAVRDLVARSLEADTSHGEMGRYLSSTFCPELVRHPSILALAEPVRPALAALFGTDRAPVPVTAQIALRFPEKVAGTDRRHGFHLDGYPSGENGVPRGTVFRSTVLVGVYLTPVRGPARGNFVVWPGSHRRFARFFRELDAVAFLREHGAETLLTRIRAHDVGPEQQLEVEPGDVVIAHHLLAHGAADNLSLQTREAIYFRLLHADDRAGDPQPLLDETRFFDGVRFPPA